MQSDDASEPTCPICGAAMFWEDCFVPDCADGYVDEYESDPINLAPGEEIVPCPECHGRGGWWICPRVPHEDFRP